jgi:hypothetical protein
MMERLLTKGTKMANTLIDNLEKAINRLEDEKDCYYAENHNRTDEHIMYLVGQIDGIKSTLTLIKGA